MNNLDYTNILVDGGEGDLLPPRSSNKGVKKVNLTKVDLKYPNENNIDAPYYKLPPNLEDELLKVRFAIPKEQLQFVKYLLSLAPVYLNNPLYSSFKPEIKNDLQNIGYEMIKQSFHVLVDYTYDPDTMYFSRSKEITSETIEALMMFKILAGKVSLFKQLEISFSNPIFKKDNYQQENSQYYIYAQILNQIKITSFFKRKPLSIDDIKTNDEPIILETFLEREKVKNKFYNIYKVKVISNIGDYVYSFGATQDEYDKIKKQVLNDFYHRHSSNASYDMLNVQDCEIELMFSNISNMCGILEIPWLHDKNNIHNELTKAVKESFKQKRDEDDIKEIDDNYDKIRSNNDSNFKTVQEKLTDKSFSNYYKAIADQIKSIDVEFDTHLHNVHEIETNIEDTKQLVPQVIDTVHEGKLDGSDIVKHEVIDREEIKNNLKSMNEFYENLRKNPLPDPQVKRSEESLKRYQYFTSPPSPPFDRSMH